jgi:hypothetical protein
MQFRKLCYLLFLIGFSGGRLQDDGTDYRAFCDQTNEVCFIKIGKKNQATVYWTTNKSIYSK